MKHLFLFVFLAGFVGIAVAQPEKAVKIDRATADFLLWLRNTTHTTMGMADSLAVMNLEVGKSLAAGGDSVVVSSAQVSFLLEHVIGPRLQESAVVSRIMKKLVNGDDGCFAAEERMVILSAMAPVSDLHARILQVFRKLQSRQ